ncbi:hypothetical protein B0H19DRAFT_1055708 [Mycena capillaripes]|nr:hypothetical protein B0H19DRAFT_1055708 [Mycena capillaripes]
MSVEEEKKIDKSGRHSFSVSGTKGSGTKGRDAVKLNQPTSCKSLLRLRRPEQQYRKIGGGRQKEHELSVCAGRKLYSDRFTARICASTYAEDGVGKRRGSMESGVEEDQDKGGAARVWQGTRRAFGEAGCRGRAGEDTRRLRAAKSSGDVRLLPSHLPPNDRGAKANARRERRDEAADVEVASVARFDTPSGSEENPPYRRHAPDLRPALGTNAREVELDARKEMHAENLSASMWRMGWGSEEAQWVEAPSPPSFKFRAMYCGGVGGGQGAGYVRRTGIQKEEQECGREHAVTEGESGTCAGQGQLWRQVPGVRQEGYGKEAPYCQVVGRRLPPVLPSTVSAASTSSPTQSVYGRCPSLTPKSNDRDAKANTRREETKPVRMETEAGQSGVLPLQQMSKWHPQRISTHAGGALRALMREVELDAGKETRAENASGR